MATKFQIALAALMCAWVAGCSRTGGDSKYPNRLIELIVPWAAGGGTDRVARFIADELQRRLGQPVVVVNRTGGSGAVGHSAGALAPADGYTITMGTFELSTMRSMGISKLTWRDFQPVAQINGDPPAILVRKDAAWQTLPELIDAIKKAPKKYKMSGTATGGAWDLTRSGLLLAVGIEPRDVIWSPTQGSAPALVELLGGHIDVVCCSVPEAAAQLESGQIRVLAVLGANRLEYYPQYPTAREQGISYEAMGWRGILLPKNTPSAIAVRLSDALGEILKSDSFRDKMRKNGFNIEFRGPEDFAAFLEKEEARWTEVIKNAGYDRLGENHDPGPNLMPRLILIGLVLAGVGEWISSRKRKVDLETTGIPRNAIYLIVTLAVYLALMPRFGFVITTGLFSCVVMWRLGTRWWQAVLASTVMVGAIYLLFVAIFKVQLP